MSPDPTRWFRRFLLGVAALVYATVAADLWLIGHYEEWRQWAPFVTVALGLVAVGWQLQKPSAGGVRAVRVTSGLAVLTGLAGVWLHVVSNYELEREVNSGYSALEAAWAALGGGTPAIAPGMVALAGILAVAATRRETAA